MRSLLVEILMSIMVERPMWMMAEMLLRAVGEEVVSSIAGGGGGAMGLIELPHRPAHGPAQLLGKLLPQKWSQSMGPPQPGVGEGSIGTKVVRRAD